MPKLVIVNGFPRAGKDTLIEHMRMMLAQRGHHTKNVSMIDSTREMLSSNRYVKDALQVKGSETRQLLAGVHRALLDNTDAPILSFFDAASVGSPKVVFTCCREPDTIERLRRRALGNGNWSVKTLLVKRDPAEELVTEADRNVLDFEYDLEVDNNQPLAFMPLLAASTLEQLGLTHSFKKTDHA